MAAGRDLIAGLVQLAGQSRDDGGAVVPEAPPGCQVREVHEVTPPTWRAIAALSIAWCLAAQVTQDAGETHTQPGA